MHIIITPFLQNFLSSQRTPDKNKTQRCFSTKFPYVRYQPSGFVRREIVTIPIICPRQAEAPFTTKYVPSRHHRHSTKTRKNEKKVLARTRKTQKQRKRGEHTTTNKQITNRDNITNRCCLWKGTIGQLKVCPPPFVTPIHFFDMHAKKRIGPFINRLRTLSRSLRLFMGRVHQNSSPIRQRKTFEAWCP